MPEKEKTPSPVMVEENPIVVLRRRIGEAGETIRRSCETPEKTMRRLPQQVVGTVLPLLDETVDLIGRLAVAVEGHFADHASQDAIDGAADYAAALVEVAARLDVQLAALREGLLKLVEEPDLEVRRAAAEALSPVLVETQSSLGALIEQMSNEEAEEDEEDEEDEEQGAEPGAEPEGEANAAG